MYKRILILLFTGIIICTCESGVETEKELDLRNFKWSIDTIKYKSTSQTMMNSICGNSTDNLWVSGHSSSAEGKIWKYLNKNWSSIPTADYSHDSFINLNVNIVGASGRIFFGGDFNSENKEYPIVFDYFEGNWKSHYPQSSDESITSITSFNSDELYAGGSKGGLWWYNGTKWVKNNFEISASDKVMNEIYSIQTFNNEIHALIKSFNESENTHSFLYLVGQWENLEIKSSYTFEGYSTNWKFGDIGLFKKNDKLYSYGRSLSILENDSWKRIIPSLDDSNPIHSMEAFDDENLVFVTAFKKPLYWNGNSLIELENFPGSSGLYYSDIKIINNIIYILAFNGSTSFIYTGSQE